MAAQILDGKALAATIKAELTERVAALAERGVVPGLGTVLVGDARPVLYLLAGAALLVLLTVCANLGNLFLWKSLARGRELAVRAALGASRARLVRQVLAESVVVALCGGVLGLALSHLLIGVTRAVADRAGALAPSSVDLRVVGFAVLLSVLVGLLFGAWPALRASRL